MADGQAKIENSEAEVGYQKRRFSFDEFWRLWEDGTLEAGNDGLRFELWEGDIRMVPPPDGSHGRPHAKLNKLLLKALIELGLEDSFEIHTQYGLRLSEDVYVGPDLFVLDAGANTGERYPPLHRVRLVVETASSSLQGDLTFKRDKYAEAGIPEYWVQDVENKRLHVFRDPASGTYTEHLRLEDKAAVNPLFEQRINLIAGDLF